MNPILFQAKILKSDEYITGHYMSRIIGGKTFHYITKIDVYDWIEIDYNTINIAGA